MAKKKQELTVEEKLAAALVREDEQPYAVPGNWVWVSLNTLYNFIDYRGKTPHKISSGVPLITAKNVKQGYIDYSIAEFISHEEYLTRQTRGTSQKGDILFTTEAPLGNVAIADLDKFSAGQRLITFQKYSHTSSLNNKFYALYMLSGAFKKDINDRKTGTTVAGIKAEKLKLVPIPLPPLAEQQRIVDRIESLFDQLDQAKELIQAALDSFENRKATILHQAFTGALTKKWRAAHGVGMESWSIRPLSELCTSFQYGTSKKSLTSGKVAVIRMGNLQQGEIRWDSLAYTDDKEDIEKYLLKKGDVLFNRTNSPELVGKTSVYRGEYPAIFAGYLIRLRNNDMLNSYYLNYMMNSQRAKIYCNSVKTDGVNQSNINAKKIAAFEIPHCSIPEQQEIVRILDDLFEKEQNAKDLCDLIDQIEAMKKTILGKAFRGELGTNEAEDESAVKLLKELINN